MLAINIIFALALAFRLYTLKISKKHEKALLESGAKEHGAINSKLLSLAHVAFYISCIVEANISKAPFIQFSAYGLGILIFSYLMLILVIRELKSIWTVKIYILKDHKINTSALFRFVRHPNYFLNIIPELIGLSMVCSAYNTATWGLPIYFAILAFRIYQEENAMAHLAR